MRPTFGSLFSGIGGFDLGLERAGWEARWQVEIDPWRRQVLARHWPDVPRFGDVREFGPVGIRPYQQEGRERLAPTTDREGIEQRRRAWGDLGVDLICGGFPCQDLSVAGKRAGLAGERSGLWWEFARIIKEIAPAWLLIENVPGLLTASKGHDFAVIVDTLADLGYGLAWRILDSQHFGVPQRRRRVYIVGCLGAPCPPEILFEPEGGGGDSTAGGKAGQEVTGSLGEGAEIVGPLVGNQGPNTHGSRGVNSLYDVFAGHTIAHALNAHPGPNRRIDAESETFIAQPLRASTRGNAESNIAGTVTGAEVHNGNSNPIPDNYVCAPPDADGVREIAGVPGSLDPDPRTPDGRRYAALGDAVTVNVIEWIGRRLNRAVAHA